MNENQLKLLEEFVPFYLKQLGEYMSFDTSFSNADIESRHFKFMVQGEDDNCKLKTVEIEKNVYEVKIYTLRTDDSHTYLTSDDYERESSRKYITKYRLIFSNSPFKEFQDAEEDESLLPWASIIVAKYSSSPYSPRNSNLLWHKIRHQYYYSDCQKLVPKKFDALLEDFQYIYIEL